MIVSVIGTVIIVYSLQSLSIKMHIYHVSFLEIFFSGLENENYFSDIFNIHSMLSHFSQFVHSLDVII